MKRIVTVLLLFTGSFAHAGDEAEPGKFWEDAHQNLAVDKSMAQHQRVQWWRDGRLGLLVLWRLEGETQPAAADHRPEPFDAKTLVALSEQAGMKYLLVAAKGRDGACLWETQLKTARRAALGRDLLGEMAAAVRDSHVKLGFYLAQSEAQEPVYHKAPAAYEALLGGQLRELLGKYGPVGVLECDAAGYKPDLAAAERIFRLIGQLQPAIVVNNRLGVPADFDAPQPLFNVYNTRRNWEARIALGASTDRSPGAVAESMEEVVKRLVYCAGADGNLLVEWEVSPLVELPLPSVERLERIGRWMEKYGESIQGTSGGPYRPGKWGASTRKDRRLYLHVLDWSKFPPRLPVLTRKIKGLTVLTGGAAQVKQYNDGLAIQVPPDRRDKFDTILCLELDGPASEIQPVTLPEKKGHDRPRP